MATLSVTWNDVVRALLKERGIDPDTVKRISFETDGASLTVGYKGRISITYQDEWYPVLCMDCQEPYTTSRVEGSTGLCDACLHSREEHRRP